MAQIYGQIQPLKRLREELNLKGIERFNSIGDIRAFLNNFSLEQNAIYIHYTKEFEKEIAEIEEKIRFDERRAIKTKQKKITQLNAKIDRNKKHLTQFQKWTPKFFLLRAIRKICMAFFNWRLNRLQKNYGRKLDRSSKHIEKIIHFNTKKLYNMQAHKEAIIRSMSAKDLRHLEFTKKVVEELNPHIVGAIGENKVVNEIKKLPDNNVLINDFRLNFNQAIYNKSEDSWIKSIQIDHLLITKAGVFILETKNWSANTINQVSLWSPVDQIRRSSFALFILLKKKKIRLNWHHWGEKQIPVRSIIVMINKKPKEEFEYVKVKTLRELNAYIQYFTPIFSDREVERITNYFIKLSGK